jgi:DNA-binding NarL/FixJ family response regulator
MKILVVDDHVLIREALRGVLKELEADAEVLEAADAGGAARCLEENPDLELVLLDLYLPDASGFDLLARLRERHPAVPVAVLSVSSERADITRALELGAVGFIPKSARRDVMLGAFRLIFAGGVYVPPEIFGRGRPALAAPPTRGRPPSAAELGLTERQFEVLGLLVQGKSNKAICRALGLAEPTVKNHVTAILKALKVSNRTEAALAAAARGLGRPHGAE